MRATGASLLAMVTAKPVPAQVAPADSGQAQLSTGDRISAELDAPPAEVVVTGVRQFLEGAAEVKQAAVQVVDSIVATDIGARLRF